MGLGVAAMAQMRNSENASLQQQNVLIGSQNPSMQQQRFDVISHSQNPNLMTGNSILDSHQNSLDQVLFYSFKQFYFNKFRILEVLEVS